MKKIFIFLMILLVPSIALAAEYTYNVTLIPDSVENALELVNLLIAILVAVFAVKLAALSQGGQLEKTWNLIAIVAVLFALLEVVGALKGFNLVRLGGAGDIIEFVFGIVFFTAVYKTRKSLLKQVLNK